MKIRRIPYPYICALSISNDCEFCKIDFLDNLFAFCNTSHKTPLGDGLNIPLSNSMFFFSPNPLDSPYFDVNGKEKKAWHGRLIDYCKTGYIDTIHSYGNFNACEFTPYLAANALEELERIGLSLSVYTNHGTAGNIQNMGGEASYHLGDVPGSSAYHADMTIGHGVRFLWSDGLVMENWRPSIKGMMRRFYKSRASQPFNLFKEDTLQDGQPIVKFYRYRGTGRYAPNLSSLGYQLSDDFFQELINRRGQVVIYQHLGILYKAGECVPATPDALRSQPHLMAPFRRLARYYYEGQIWVERLAVFLNFFFWRDRIRVSVHSDDHIEIVPELPMEAEHAHRELQYQTIYVDYERPLRVMCLSRELPVHYNGPDESGQYSITIAPLPREDIWC